MDKEKALKLTRKFLKNPPSDEIWNKCREYFHFEYLVARFYAEGYEIVESKPIPTSSTGWVKLRRRKARFKLAIPKE